ncbi:hypothetical protein [Ulvibacter litoralis]|uniref:Lipocalin-like domain-containing protein n=1 Tax=Ulvibacter litoralis TaxID=227084 RepID=A0A1G7EXW1_9FLAO|nr:hypothetical protein [Ulvibacter litoralis]GHC53468.1 hypothetical protein GCM10008083_16870 [Ulvibacter litoralis]SDE68533.1 hypothetical protein SAMN05421855_102212 [Ulvibacter litoralis]
MKPFILAVSLLLFVACDSDDDTNNNANAFENIVTELPQGNWEVSYFYKNDMDDTQSYSAFTFTFNENGTVDAINDILTESGVWSYDGSDDTSDDDGIENDEELDLQFPQNGLLKDLSEDWHITAVSSSEIVLYDISDGNSSADFLTFRKI